MMIFSFVMLFPVLPIIYFMLRNETKPKKNIILGVTLPLEARGHKDVLAICGAYKKRLGLTCLILAVLPVTALFIIKYDSVMTTVLMAWLNAAIILPYAVYTITRLKLKKLKNERSWGVPSSVTIVDTEVILKPMKLIGAAWFVPPFAASLLPVASTLSQSSWDASSWLMLIVYIVNALLVLLFYFIYRLIGRRRTDIIDEDTALTGALTRVRRYNWGKFTLISAWLTGAFNICFWLFQSSALGIMISTGVFVTALLAASIRTEFASRNAQQKLTQNSGRPLAIDDDALWLNGMFYFNPNDRHFTVNNRVGLGMTVNLARPAAKAVMVFSVLCLLLTPMVGVWLMHLEFSPPSIEITGNQIIAYHTGKSYTVPINTVESAELIDNLPSASRQMGTGLKNLYKGKFRLDGIGLCEVNLNPSSPPFLILRTTDTIYVLGSNNPSETIGAFNSLK